MSRNLRVLLVAERGVDQHQPVGMLDQQAAHGERNPVALVRARSACSRASAAPRRTSRRRRAAGGRPRACGSAARRPGTCVSEASRQPLRQRVRPRLGRAWRGASAGPAPYAPERDRAQVLQRARALLARQPEQPRQQLGGHQRVARGAVPRRVLEAEVAASGCRARTSGRPSPAGAPAARCRAAARRARGRARGAARRSRISSRTARCGPRTPGRPARRRPGRPARRTSARPAPCRW